MKAIDRGTYEGGSTGNFWVIDPIGKFYILIMKFQLKKITFLNNYFKMKNIISYINLNKINKILFKFYYKFIYIRWY